MLREITHSSGPVILTSDLLARAGFHHAFSTRLGGVSAAPFDSLNLQSVQANARIAEAEARDTESNIRENHARFVRWAQIRTTSSQQLGHQVQKRTSKSDPQ